MPPVRLTFGAPPVLGHEHRAAVMSFGSPPAVDLGAPTWRCVHCGIERDENELLWGNHTSFPSRESTARQFQWRAECVHCRPNAPPPKLDFDPAVDGGHADDAEEGNETAKHLLGLPQIKEAGLVREDVVLKMVADLRRRTTKQSQKDAHGSSSTRKSPRGLGASPRGVPPSSTTSMPATPRAATPNIIGGLLSPSAASPSYAPPSFGSPSTASRMGSPRMGTPRMGTPRMGSPRMGSPRAGAGEIRSPAHSSHGLRPSPRAARLGPVALPPRTGTAPAQMSRAKMLQPPGTWQAAAVAQGTSTPGSFTSGCWGTRSASPSGGDFGGGLGATTRPVTAEQQPQQQQSQPQPQVASLGSHVHSTQDSGPASRSMLEQSHAHASSKPMRADMRVTPQLGATWGELGRRPQLSPRGSPRAGVALSTELELPRGVALPHEHAKFTRPSTSSGLAAGPSATDQASSSSAQPAASGGGRRGSGRMHFGQGMNTDFSDKLVEVSRFVPQPHPGLPQHTDAMPCDALHSAHCRGCALAQSLAMTV